jgi:hypothetical protein
MPNRRPAVVAVLLGLALTLPMAGPAAAAPAGRGAAERRTMRAYAEDTESAGRVSASHEGALRI